MRMPSENQDNSGDSYSFRYSADDDGQPLKGIVKAVSWFKGVDGRALDPLYSVIDPEPLSDLFGAGGGEFYRHERKPDREDVQVTFSYEECLVTVTPDQILVGPAAQS
jgi:hypothetical protein